MDDAGPHFFHRHPLKLVRRVRTWRAIQSRQCATTQLLCTLRRDVDKKKPARDRCRSLRFSAGGGLCLRILFNHNA